MKKVAVLVVVLIVTIVLMCIPATSAFGVGMFIAGFKAAVRGAIIGGIMSAINGNSFLEGLLREQYTDL